MNEKMVAFIICTNDETYLKECIYYIEHLNVPQDFMIDIIAITEAEYMTGAYNAAMKESDAKYKVYLHQDVFIINRNFIADMLEVFADEQVGMIGMFGCDRYPKDARFSSAWNVGKVFACNILKTYLFSYDTPGGKDREVVAIDGMLMATQYDVEWNENLKGWHFYDASQSIEFSKMGLKIMVPYQETPWILHDAGWCDMLQYDKGRRIFCDLYEKWDFDYDIPDYSERQMPPDNFVDNKKKVFELVGRGKFADAVHLIDEILKGYREDTDLSLLVLLFGIYIKEIKTDGKSNVFGSLNWGEIKGYYNAVKFLLRRIEYGFEISEYKEIISFITNGQVSASYLSAVIEHSIYYQQRVWEELFIRCTMNAQWTYENLIFDQFQRYHTLGEVVRSIKCNIGIEECRILEVGANVQKNLGKELYGDNVYYTDLKIPEEFADDNRCFRADATNLWQVQDQQYDFAVASDVFEHIPIEGRQSFLTELYRVVKEAVVICFPRKSQAVEMAELQMNAHFKSLTGKDHRWLKEHIDNGLPECEEIDAFLRKNEIEFVSFTHGELEMWKKMLKIHNITAVCPQITDYRRLIDKYYNQYIYQCDSGKEDYRVFYILLKNDRIDRNIFGGLISKEQDLSKKQEIFNMCDELLQISILYRNVSGV